MLRTDRRLLAFAVAAFVVLAQLLVLHHAGDVTHVKTALTGEYAHAHALGEHHAASSTQHLHSTAPHEHADGAICHLLAGLDHGSAITSTATVHVALSPRTASAAFVPDAPLAFTAQLLLLAPKTSPPRA